MNWAALIGFLLVGLLVPADVAQAQAVFVSEIEHPPEDWKRIYHEVEACVGRKGKFKAIHWYVASAPWGVEPALTYGLWRIKDGRRSIIVARGDTAVVRHEVLHDILHHAGFRPFHMAGDNSTNPEHPSPAFGVCAKRFFP